MNDFLTLMKPELIITVIIFLLLFIKIGKGLKNETMLLLIQVLLLLNFVAGFFFSAEGTFSDGIYIPTNLIVFKKSI